MKTELWNALGYAVEKSNCEEAKVALMHLRASFAVINMKPTVEESEAPAHFSSNEATAWCHGWAAAISSVDKGQLVSVN